MNGLTTTETRLAEQYVSVLDYVSRCARHRPWRLVLPVRQGRHPGGESRAAGRARARGLRRPRARRQAVAAAVAWFGRHYRAARLLHPSTRRAAMIAPPRRVPPPVVGWPCWSWSRSWRRWLPPRQGGPRPGRRRAPAVTPSTPPRPGRHRADLHQRRWLPTRRRLPPPRGWTVGSATRAGRRGRPLPDSGVVPAHRPFLVRQGHPSGLQPQRLARGRRRPGRRPPGQPRQRRGAAAGGLDRPGPGRGPAERGRLPLDLRRPALVHRRGHQGHLHVGFAGPTRPGGGR